MIYVCPAISAAGRIGKVLMAYPDYYSELRDKFDGKRLKFSSGLEESGFKIDDSGSAFYIWAKIPSETLNAIAFNEMLMEKAGVGMTPGAAFADTTPGTISSASASPAKTRFSAGRWRNFARC